MSVMGVWIVGVVADDAVEEARRRFPCAAGAHGMWRESSAVTSLWPEGAEPAGSFDEMVRFDYAVDRARNNETDVDEFQDHLLHAVPQ